MLSRHYFAFLALWCFLGTVVLSWHCGAFLVLCSFSAAVLIFWHCGAFLLLCCILPVLASFLLLFFFRRNVGEGSHFFVFLPVGVLERLYLEGDCFFDIG